MQYQKPLKYAAVSSLFLLLFASICTFFFHKEFHEMEIFAQADLETEITPNSPNMGHDTNELVITEIFQKFPQLHKADTELAGEQSLILSKETLGANAMLTAEVSYVNFQITITIHDYNQLLNLNKSDIFRKAGDHIYYGKPSKSATDSDDFVRSINISEQKFGETSANVLQIILNTKNIYECQVLEDQNFFYLILQRPKDIYDKIVAVDAGHGGRDSGTPVAGKEHYEKQYNLAVLLELKKIMDLQDEIKVYYTRTDDSRLTLNQRVDMANDLEADLFISFHCNSSELRSVSGMEVLYNEKQDGWGMYSSKQFSQMCLEEINQRFPVRNRGIIPRSENVHIIGAAEMPIALIEAVYLSNASDLLEISKKGNQKLIAEGTYQAILRYLDTITY